MTSFLAWLAVDSRRPTGLYFASDSRRSFPDGRYYDDCVKLFAPRSSADIFGMLGNDITFPWHALRQLCTRMDAGEHGTGLTMAERIEWIRSELVAMKLAVPGGGSFSVFHGSREAFGMRAEFSLMRYRYRDAHEDWSCEKIDLQHRESQAVVFDGTGNEQVWWGVTRQRVALGPVSRACFSGFCASLTAEDRDPLSGGVPQLLGLGSVGAGRHYGLVMPNGSCYGGQPVGQVPPGTQWRDSNFEPVTRQGKSTRNKTLKRVRRQAR